MRRHPVTRRACASYTELLHTSVWVVAWAFVPHRLFLEWGVAAVLSYAAWLYVRRR